MNKSGNFIFEQPQARTIYVLIGPPAIGKSTYIKNTFKNAVVVSRDDIVNNVASGLGLTYDDLYVYPTPADELGELVPGKEKFGPVIQNDDDRMKQYYPTTFEKVSKTNKLVANVLRSTINSAIKSGKDIVIDMVNMSKLDRKINLGDINRHPEFKKIAVVFNFKDPDAADIIGKLADKRNQEIKKQGGSKTISPEVIKRIITSFEEPSSDEGYNKIIHVNTLDKLRDVANGLSEVNMGQNDYPDFFDSLANPTFKNRPYPKVAFFNQPLLQEKRRRVSDNVVNYVFNKLGITGANFLDSGGYGDAFVWGDKVIKFSTDYREAKFANELSKHHFKHIANIEKVMRFKEKNGDWIFIVFVEKLNPIAEHERPIYRYYEKVAGAYGEYSHVFKKQSKPVMSFEQVIQNIDDPSLAEFFDPWVIREVKAYSDEMIFFHKQITELKKEVSQIMPADQVDKELSDFSNTGNMGRKADGTFAFFDLQWDGSTKDTSNLRTIKETEMTASEVNVKKLPYQFSNMITDFIAEKSIEELREIAPTLNLSQNPILIVKQMDREYPGLFDNFAQWISDKI